jgi:hypothetical protein
MRLLAAGSRGSPRDSSEGGEGGKDSLCRRGCANRLPVWGWASWTRGRSQVGIFSTDRSGGIN